MSLTTRKALARALLVAAAGAICALPAKALQASGQGVVTIGLQDQSLVDGTFNVSPFGVVSTDARRTFSEAFDSLPPGGGEIVVLPGTYRFESTLEITRSGVTIRGSRGVVFKSINNHPEYDQKGEG